MVPGVTDFLRVSAELGSDPRHVQGPGGNTSFKTGPDTMLVKASGFELARALDENVFATVNFARVRENLARDTPDPLQGCFDASGPKPSIETTLHALMPHRVVIHTHSLVAIATACLAAARARLTERLGDLAWVLADYTRPGTPLAKRVGAELASRPGANVVVLGNHGIVVGADTALAARELLLDVTGRLNGPRRSPERAPELDALTELARRHGLALPDDPVVHELALHPESVALATRGTLYPDHVVFLGSKVGRLEERGPAAGPLSPRLWLVPGQGVLMEAGLPKAAQALAACLAEVVALLTEPESCRYLSEAEEAAILGMEEEQYRQSLARREN